MAATTQSTSFDLSHFPEGFSYNARESKLTLPDGRKVSVDLSGTSPGDSNT